MSRKYHINYIESKISKRIGLYVGRSPFWIKKPRCCVTLIFTRTEQIISGNLDDKNFEKRPLKKAFNQYKNEISLQKNYLSPELNYFWEAAPSKFKELQSARFEPPPLEHSEFFKFYSSFSFFFIIIWEFHYFLVILDSG